MDKPYFVMLHNQRHDRLVPMADPEGELYMYATREEAAEAATRTWFGEHFGFEVFREGGGE